MRKKSKKEPKFHDDLARADFNLLLNAGSKKGLVQQMFSVSQGEKFEVWKHATSSDLRDELEITFWLKLVAMVQEELRNAKGDEEKCNAIKSAAKEVLYSRVESFLDCDVAGFSDALTETYNHDDMQQCDDFVAKFKSRLAEMKHDPDHAMHKNYFPANSPYLCRDSAFGIDCAKSGRDKAHLEKFFHLCPNFECQKNRKQKHLCTNCPENSMSQRARDIFFRGLKKKTKPDRNYYGGGGRNHHKRRRYDDRDRYNHDRQDFQAENPYKRHRGGGGGAPQVIIVRENDEAYKHFHVQTR